MIQVPPPISKRIQKDTTSTVNAEKKDATTTANSKRGSNDATTTVNADKKDAIKNISNDATTTVDADNKDAIKTFQRMPLQPS